MVIAVISELESGQRGKLAPGKAEEKGARDEKRKKMEDDLHKKDLEGKNKAAHGTLKQRRVHPEGMVFKSFIRYGLG